MQWKLGAIKLSPFVTLEVYIDTHGEVAPCEIYKLGLLLQWVGDSCQKWLRKEEQTAAALARLHAADDARLHVDDDGGGE